MQKVQEIFKSSILKLPEFILPFITKFESMGKKTIDPQLLSQAQLVVSMLPSEYIIEEFIKNSFSNGDNFWDFVAQRSEISILRGLCNIFTNVLNYESISEIFNERDEVGNLVINNDVKESFFGKLDVLIKLSIRYVHEKREPYSVKKNGKIQKFYEKEFFEKLDIPKYSTIFFGKSLSFPLYDA